MAKQVGAKIEGDIFQGLFFWYRAIELLNPYSGVIEVGIEHDSIPGVDDVFVKYQEPGVNSGGNSCIADYFQIKYHLDRSKEYSHKNICDPNFTKGKKSLLQRFFDGWSNIPEQKGRVRLHLVSNWQWEREDKLAPLLRDSTDGALPDNFFSGGPGSDLGRIRNHWKNHLQADESDFYQFARSLRLRVDYLSRSGLLEAFNDRLLAVGLKRLDFDKAKSAYDSLTQQFITGGKTTFDRDSFREMCEREDLFSPMGPQVTDKIGIRSFMRFAESMESECSKFVCVSGLFEGRFIREQRAWNGRVLSEVRSFLRNPEYRQIERGILLDCHSSIAFLAGYELDRKSGAKVYPVQKGLAPETWKPDLASYKPKAFSDVWTVRHHPKKNATGNLVLAISATRQVFADVETYIDKSFPDVDEILDVEISSGVGATSVSGANHALNLADQIAELIRKSSKGGKNLVHLFMSAPNSIFYFLGQHRKYLGKVQLYEFDFDQEQGGSYKPSIRFPYPEE
jgi:hypothetical protein